MYEYTKIAELPIMDEETRVRYEKWKRKRIRKRVVFPGIGLLCVIILLIFLFGEAFGEAYSTEESPVESYVAKLLTKTDVEAEPEIESEINEEAPIVYLFNAHPRELIGSTYENQFEGEMCIVEVTHILADHLESHGISTLVEERCVDAKLKENDWGFYMSYYAARYFVLDAKNQYSSLEFFVDLHRDGVLHEHATAEIDGVAYAQVLFVIGTDNPMGYAASYEVASELHDMLEERKPGISRGIFESGGTPGRDGVYSQDISPMVQLIELGTITSSVEEVSLTVEVLADVIAEYISLSTEDEIEYPEVDLGFKGDKDDDSTFWEEDNGSTLEEEVDLTPEMEDDDSTSEE